MSSSMVHRHRNVQGGIERAAVFGVSDGLVSNVALILGIAGASADPSMVRVAGVSGLLAGAISMAAGEYVSLKAQAELVERELAIERVSLAENPEFEIAELAAIYQERGLSAEHAETVARELMADPEVALEIHAREELGVDPSQVGDPIGAALTSFAAFVIGAFIPLAPWIFGAGSWAVEASVGLGIGASAGVGGLLAWLTERSMWRTVLRQVLVTSGACGATYLIGSLLGAAVS